MDFKRHIIKQLTKWKENPNSKPLILRGARQVGKTTLIHHFSKNFNHYIYLNLEKNKDLNYFNQYDDIKSIVETLFLNFNIPISEINQTLLFIDEIQESPKAIKLLRYFYEDFPKLKVVSAGSLLEFALRHVKNFPVGRIEYLYLHPLNFEEFLMASNQKLGYEQLNIVPLKKTAHQFLMDKFHQFAIMGGMPEIIKTFLTHNSYTELPKVYESIWESYKNDVEKYSTNHTEQKVIKHIINVAHLYLDERIKFQNFGKSNYKSREVGEAFRHLDDAKIIQLIYPTTSFKPPLKPDIKKSPRLQFLDTGLINYSNQIQAQLIALKDLSYAYQGKLIPHIFTQELISLNTIKYNKPMFWVRDKKGSSAEIDLIYQHEEIAIPIEIKSGKTGTLKSLHLFIDQVEHHYAVRVYGGEFLVEKTKTPSGKPYVLMNLPYFVGTKLKEYINWFVKNH